MTTQSTTPASPPPLPLPGSATRPEELPPAEPDRADRDVAAGPAAARSPHGCLASLTAPVRTYLVFMAFFVVLWAVGGGGHFWPIWPALGWGLGLVNSGAVRVGRHPGRDG